MAPSPSQVMTMKKSRHVKHAKQTRPGIVYMVPGQGRTAPDSGRSARPGRKLNLRTLFLVLFSVWALYTYFFVLMPNKIRLEKERQQIEQQLTDLRQKEQQLTTELSNLQDDSYIARLARKYYNMTKQGEIKYEPGK